MEEISRAFKIERSVRQKCFLVLLLFAIEPLSEKVHRLKKFVDLKIEEVS
jgi:hypothetical protein